MGQEIILVAGIDYALYKLSPTSKWKWQFHAEQKGRWRKYCERVAKRALKQDKSLRVTLFDFHRGTRETLTLNRGTLNCIPVEDVPFGKLNLKNYRRVDESLGQSRFTIPEKELKVKEQGEEPPSVRYVTGIEELRQSGEVDWDDYKLSFYDSKLLREKSISITDVYDYIRQIGATRPNTLKEFHLFSHGWYGGPIFVNTGDNYKKYFSLTDSSLEFVRDPLDKDGRARKDFPVVDVNSSESAQVSVKTFAAAFTSGATSYVWGCNAVTYVKKLIQETLIQTRGIKEAKKLQFLWKKDWRIKEHIFHDEQHFGGDSANHLSKMMSKEDVVKFLRRKIEDTYMHNLARASNNMVIGTLPGTYSDYDKNNNFGEELTHIPLGALSGNSHNFSSVLGFYKDELKIDFKPTDKSPIYGRGFCIYRP